MHTSLTESLVAPENPQTEEHRALIEGRFQEDFAEGGFSAMEHVTSIIGCSASSESIPALQKASSITNEALFASCVSKAKTGSTENRCILLGDTTGALELELFFKHLTASTHSHYGKEFLATMVAAPPRQLETIRGFQEAVADLARHPEGIATMRRLVSSVQETLLQLKKFQMETNETNTFRSASSAEQMVNTFARRI